MLCYLVNSSQDFFFRFNIQYLIFIYLLKYETIETHDRAFLTLNILAIRVHTSKFRIQNLEFFQRILTPERHENGIEHCSRMIEEIGNSFIGANIFELPIVTGFTKGAHEVLVSVLAGFNRNRI